MGKHFFVSTVCFPPEVDLNHSSLSLFLGQVIAIQTYFYNWKVLLITFFPFTLWQKIWHVMINFFILYLFLSYLILFFIIITFLPGAAYRYTQFPAPGCL